MRFSDGDKLDIEGINLDAIYTPGRRAKYDSIYNRLLKLPRETMVFPGHD